MRSEPIDRKRDPGIRRARHDLDLSANGVVAWFFSLACACAKGLGVQGARKENKEGGTVEEPHHRRRLVSLKVKAKQEASLVFKTKKITRMIK